MQMSAQPKLTLQFFKQDFAEVRLDLLNPDLHLSGGKTYPLIHYDNVPEHATLKVPHRGVLCLHVHPTRFSYQIYAQTPQSLEEIERRREIDDPADETPFRCEMQLQFELSPNFLPGDKAVHAPDFYTCQKLLYASGVGPMPSPMRDGFAVSCGGENPRSLMCMVEHKHGHHGCTAESGRCFFCVGNPFYNFTLEPAGYVYRRTPIAALSAGSIVKVGTQLLLDTKCPELLVCFPVCTHSEVPRKRRRDALNESEDNKRLLCCLQVPTNIHNAPGMLYITVQCKHGGGEMRPYTLHVSPAYLILPADPDATAFSRQYVRAT
jgi:hypothetical protein